MYGDGAVWPEYVRVLILTTFSVAPATKQQEISISTTTTQTAHNNGGLPHYSFVGRSVIDNYKWILRKKNGGGE